MKLQSDEIPNKELEKKKIYSLKYSKFRQIK